ncbi:hypothetical protein T05_70 [Trichinella murrelli]|uniref:Uncharacterized protein n=1 Tax=Trichinella murrelli TaxID=144512 RepID=A0A0V0T072_9BILA|nr:hypothetical protein T05_70 [Trichinella murrelli]
MKKKSKSGVDAVRNADGMMQNNKREKIAIKVPYRQLECTRSFDLRGKW